MNLNLFKKTSFYSFQILSLHYKIIIANKVIGEVTKEMTQLYKEASNYSEPIQLTLAAFPCTVQVTLGLASAELHFKWRIGTLPIISVCQSLSH